MVSLRNLALTLAVAIAAACVPPGAQDQADEAQGRALQPTFAPSTTAASPAPSPTTGPSPSPTAGTEEPQPSPTDTEVTAIQRSPSDPPASEPAPSDLRASAAVQDPAGDVEAPLLTDPPDYADLRSGSLAIDGDAVTLSVSFHGDTPERSDDDHTMNVASFYDVDGDGRIDYEVWGNLSPTGWGTSWFDNREGTARFGADDEVEVEVTPAAVVLRFPRRYLGGAGAFRWALAAEWGTYEALTTGRMTSDLAPDDGQPARFPG